MARAQRRGSNKVSPRIIAPDEMTRKIALTSAGYTIADVATVAGVSRQTAWQVYKRRTQSRRVQETFARMTGVPVEQLFPPIETQAA